jgi:rubrerythrin
VVELVRNLIFVWHYIRASEHLLECAAEQAKSTDLGSYFERHLEEERDHAQWLAEDLKSVGVDVRRTRVPREAVEMVGSVYYMIFHADPAALLGYMSVLEGWDLHSKLAQWERGYPASLLRTIKLHAHNDPAHAADLQGVIDSLPPERRALVEQTRSITIEYLQRAIESMLAASKGDLGGREQHCAGASAAANGRTSEPVRGAHA